jgi:uncharacterized OB-fold protein
VTTRFDQAPTIPRPIPQLAALNRPFWTGGCDGELRVQQCRSCERLVHPPVLRCPDDHGTLDYVTVSGRGTVESWTVNAHGWFPGWPDRYVIAFVVLAEDSRARLLTNLVDIDPDTIAPSMPVQVKFECHTVDDEHVFVPLFGPVGHE